MALCFWLGGFDLILYMCGQKLNFGVIAYTSAKKHESLLPCVVFVTLANCFWFNLDYSLWQCHSLNGTYLFICQIIVNEHFSLVHPHTQRAQFIPTMYFLVKSLWLLFRGCHCALWCPFVKSFPILSQLKFLLLVLCVRISLGHNKKVEDARICSLYWVS